MDSPPRGVFTTRPYPQVPGVSQKWLCITPLGLWQSVTTFMTERWVEGDYDGVATLSPCGEMTTYLHFQIRKMSYRDDCETTPLENYGRLFFFQKRGVNWKSLWWTVSKFLWNNVEVLPPSDSRGESETNTSPPHPWSKRHQKTDLILSLTVFQKKDSMGKEPENRCFLFEKKEPQKEPLNPPPLQTH